MRISLVSLFFLNCSESQEIAAIGAKKGKCNASKTICLVSPCQSKQDDLHIGRLGRGTVEMGFVPTVAPPYWQGPYGYNCLSVFY
jgi:hypothetical protein